MSVVPHGLLLASLLPSLACPGGDPAFERGLEAIDEAQLRADVVFLASPELEGRDSPGAGLDRAARYLARRLEEAGLVGAGEGGSFLLPFETPEIEPDPDGCALAVRRAGSEERAFVLGQDFVPLPRCEGAATGAPIFVGFGISARKERYDDLRHRKLGRKIAFVVEGEPRHAKLFAGPDEITEHADVHAKVAGLVDAGAAGVVIVRRPAAAASAPGDADGNGAGLRAADASAAPDAAPPGISFRHNWARWNPSTTEPIAHQRRSFEVPVVEVTARTAEELLGRDLLALAAEIEASGKPVWFEDEEVEVRVASALRRGSVAQSNVVGIVRGSDPELSGEYVVVGAHYDHVGVDVLGRIGYGADDNASGTAAMLAIVEGLRAAGTRRSVLACAFAAEEDGLVGSQELVADLPVPRESVVAMLNLDMLGFGDPETIVVLGTHKNRDLRKVLKEASSLSRGEIRKVVTDKARHLWERSDHLPFHRAGIPALFFFEGPSERDNPHYHTFRDTIARVSFDKIARSTRFVFGVAWLITQADERLPAPSRR